MALDGVTVLFVNHQKEKNAISSFLVLINIWKTQQRHEGDGVLIIALEVEMVVCGGGNGGNGGVVRLMVFFASSFVARHTEQSGCPSGARGDGL